MHYTAHEPSRRSLEEKRKYFDYCRRQSSNVLEWARLVGKLHDNRRKSGRPYSEHLDEVEGGMERALKVGPFKLPGMAGGRIHDIVEDIDDPIILEPREFEARVKAGDGFPELANKIILNPELLAFEKDGRRTSQILYDVTLKENKEYFQYMMNLLTRMDGLSGDDWLLAMVSLLLKTFDGHSNMKPGERFFYRGSAGRMLEQAMEGPAEKRMATVSEFLSSAKVSDDFYKDGRFLFKHLFESEAERQAFEQLFISSKSRNFEMDKIARAQDNITYFLPRAEAKLLVTPGMDGAVFNRQKALDFELYHWDIVRQMIKACYRNSLEVLSQLDYPKHPIYVALKAAGAKGMGQVHGFTTIVRELRHEIRPGGA